MTGEKVKCKLPKKNLKGKIKIKCESQEELTDVKIMIQQLVALDGFDEILRISKISTDKEVKVGNGKQIKLKKDLIIFYLLDNYMDLFLKRTKK